MKDKIIVFIFMGYILIFSTLHLLIPDNEISNSERRKLVSFPKIELTSEYISQVEEYLLDHFPFRDNFRSIKANFNYKVLNKLDNNDIYLKDNYIFKSNYPTNKKSLNYFIKNIDKSTSLLSESNNTYLMIIPDKNYYLRDSNFLQIDYDYIYDKVDDLNINNIDIRELMELNDYYETDTHWKQENINKVVQKLNESMKFDYKKQIYKTNTYNKFYGVYYGESAINRKPEELKYLTNDIIENVKVNYLENKKLDKVYNLDKLKSLDAYEVYLDGASALIEIINNNSKTNKELVIFRDSFASSITPLLIPYYKKITLIDNRYISSENYKKYIEFTNQDILFMYSTLLINNSYSLKG